MICQEASKCSKTHTSSRFMSSDVRKRVISWNNITLWYHPDVTYGAIATKFGSNMAEVFVWSYAKFEVRSFSCFGDITEIVKGGRGATLCPPSAPRESQCKRHIKCDPWLTYMLEGRDNVHVFFQNFINVFVVGGSSRHSWLHLVWFQKINVSKIKNWLCWNQAFS